MKKAAFVVCFLALLLALQMLAVPKYQTHAPEGSLTGEYYAQAGSHDVIFLGDCEVYENFSPITLYQEYGIPSYIRGSAQQMIWQSYYLLEETLRYETPKVVVFNVLAMKYDTPESTGSRVKREAYNRMTLDTMRWSSSKLCAILASRTEGESLLSYVFPLLRYHDRLTELTAEDFAPKGRVSDCGYLMQTGVKPVQQEYLEPQPASLEFGENSWHYLNKMADLCKSKGVELVLVKAPSLSPKWYEEWDEQVQAFAAKRQLTYINLLEADVGIDWSRDTYDAGLHLNVWGAEKAARYLGGILQEKFALPDRREDPAVSALWQEYTKTYEERKKAA